MVSILIGADIVPTPSNEAYFCNAQMQSIVDDAIRMELMDSDFNIFNFEFAVRTENGNKIVKCGPHFVVRSDVANGIRQIGINVLNLANNHVMDNGGDALRSCLKDLDRIGIRHIGAGTCKSEAEKPLILEKDGIRIGVFACAEHEFSIAGQNRPGANPFCTMWTFSQIEELKKRVDYLICLYHGGHEHYRYPSPELQERCRRMVECGANIVIAQHSHCIGCEERWQNGRIVYGQGNFLFDKTENEYRNTALLIRIRVKANVSDEIDYIPIEKYKNGVRIASNRSALDAFRERTRRIAEEGFVESQYENASLEYLNEYLIRLRGHRSFLDRVIEKIKNWLGYSEMRCYSKEELASILNCIECEAHREAIITAIHSKLTRS